MKDYRVWAEIDLNRLSRNLEEVRRRIGKEVRILAVVKADGYGHGAVPCAWRAIQAGADCLGVGDSSEAIALRESGITGDVVVLGAIIETEVSKVIQYDIMPTAHSMDFLKLLNDEAERQEKTVKVHIKVDTGMGRLGASPKRAVEIALEMKNYPCLRLEGLATHLSSVSSANREYTEKQLAVFNSVIEDLRRHDIAPAVIHAANSAGMIVEQKSHFNMVRVGISMYGIDPGIFAPRGFKLDPILSLKSRIAYLKSVPAETFIGYDQKYRVPAATRIATIPVGYNDGYPYGLSNKGEVLIRGVRAPIRGTVTMDYIMVDVGHIDDTAVGDEVTLIGRDGEDELLVTDLAKKIGTIPYEITCGLGKRVKRVYQ